MSNIGKIDRNLTVTTNLQEKDIRFYSAKEEPFKVYGLYDYKNQSPYKRMPDDVAKAVSEVVESLYRHTAGGRVRFSTDSKYVAIKAVMGTMARMPHMTFAGSCGFDLYVDGVTSRYYKTFMPDINSQNGYESIIYFEDAAQKSLTINFPLYNGVDELYIGLQEDAFIGEGAQYANAVPVVYYGSSITQGGCASRPGNSYQSIISRKYNTDYINLGFSGSAKGERAMAEYISGLEMSVFVMDYDHNAPSAGYLEESHKPFFDVIREKNPLLPVVMVSRPSPERVSDGKIRRDIIFKTYKTALDSGDENVYFIDGMELFGSSYRDCATVDGTHPNDFGFVHMADVIGNVVGRILGREV